ncbi:hypothetical protein L226DRAFT_336365 [Lentinus tigrinus ALCF2SS1-7]|uniref:uncharacterized protein n=1 Tax=Lentinus tigrinus ALCF2SS1-7 TaxID=1328758 RepID=UPI001165E031|nr:hypothetical protein L226DRAFT_336365 [Lentinus tigrinus ALCF2SS1-7]
MALDASFTRTRGLEPELAKIRNKQMFEDAKMNTVGPMPVRDFMHDFLYVPHLCDTFDLLSSRGAFSRVPAHTDMSEELCGDLLLALNQRTRNKSRCPGFIFEKSVEPPSRGLGDMKPDIFCYATGNVEAVDASASPRAELGYAELFIEVKADPSHDFFVDPPDATDDDSQDHDFFPHCGDVTFNRRRNRAFGQHISYVTEIFARQYRVALFTVSMSGSCARFLRWDRSGCIVSESFDIRQHPELFCDFLWRFSQTTSAVRGHDPTITAALPQEEELFRDALRAHVGYQLGVQDTELDHAMREHYEPGCVAVMVVLRHGEVANADNLHRFLVSRPVVSPLHLSGRATRGFWAVDTSTRRVVFLKDVWRSSAIEMEGEVLLRLHESGVRNIPSVLCHGDVPNHIPDVEYEIPQAEMQCTLVDEYCDESWVSNAANSRVVVGKYWHYRMVLNTVGYGLARVNGTQELLHAAYDVFHALSDVHEHASRLHRDISVGNIVLVREEGSKIRRGYLVDWDASCETDDAGEAATVGRAGTWLFMSNRMMAPRGTTIKHTLQDDLESLLYVVLYCAFLYLPHNLSDEELSRTIRLLFEDARLIDGQLGGGQGKLDNASMRTHTKPVKFNAPLKEWLDTIMDYCDPPRTLEMDDPDPWTELDLLDKFWAEFLQTHTLESNDRQAHNHPLVTDKYEVEDAVSRPASSEAISLGKRPSEEYPTDYASASKKSHCSAVVSVPTRPLRRSERLRVQQSRRAAGELAEKCTGVRTHTRYRQKC